MNYLNKYTSSDEEEDEEQLENKYKNNFQPTKAVEFNLSKKDYEKSLKWRTA